MTINQTKNTYAYSHSGFTMHLENVMGKLALMYRTCSNAHSWYSTWQHIVDIVVACLLVRGYMSACLAFKNQIFIDQ